jgi:hypothetical protein
MLAAEAYSRDLPRVFVDYDRLLADWRGEVRRIEAAHGAALPKLTAKAEKAIDEFLSPELRHNAGDGELSGLGWTGEIAAEVYAWCRDEAADRRPDRAALAHAARALAARQAEVGALVSPAARDLDALRLELRETRDRLEAEVAELRATWKRDVAGLEKDLKSFYKAIAEADAKLEAALRAP